MNAVSKLPQTWHVRQRLQLAVKRLEEPDTSIARIAFKVG